MLGPKIQNINMKVRPVAIVIFYDKDLNIIVQERGDHTRLGEKYGFFGGRIKEGETPEKAMKREFLEEIGYIPKSLEYWTKDEYIVQEEGKYKGWLIKSHVFLSPITPKLETTKITEGKGIVIMTIDEAIKSKEFPIGSTEILEKLKEKLRREN